MSTLNNPHIEASNDHANAAEDLLGELGPNPSDWAKQSSLTKATAALAHVALADWHERRAEAEGKTARATT